MTAPKPTANTILHDFAVGLHEYANGRANGLLYGEKLEQASQQLAQALIEKLPEKKDYIHRKHEMKLDPHSCGIWNEAIDEVTKIINEFFGLAA